MPKNEDPNARRPRVLFQPSVREGMRAGTEKFSRLLAPTIGPLPRTVIVNHLHERQRPEQLDSGGEIVRRILQLADRTEDVGAMFLRECLWRLHLEVGDGASTAGVVFQSVFNEGVRYIAAGGNAMQLRKHLNKGM
jgi:chaperonin GroEL